MHHNSMRILEVISSTIENKICVRYDMWFDKVKLTRMLLEQFGTYEDRVFKVREHKKFYKTKTGRGYIVVEYANSFDDLSQ